ncbi:NAD(P)-binding domain-containing protein, partial [Streptomyces swartbergensis]|uniref:NAD(P)-binding domain-containing protein n=1 Tax=Streptomyces swartbergensis TaxID=487165 RepID=UPI0037F142CF
MGRALAEAFVAAGHPTTVWNRTPGRAGPLVDQGALHAASIADAVAASGLVVTCLTTFEDTRAALEPAARASETISVGMILRQSGVMTAALVERMAPEELWTLFQ